MSDLVQYLVSGLALGSVYALVALGFVVIYRASEVFNFAHGELLTLGAFLAISFSSPPRGAGETVEVGSPAVSGLGLPFPVSVIGAITLLVAIR